MSSSRARRRAAAVVTALPLVVAAGPMAAPALAAPGVTTASLVQTLGAVRVGPRAGFRGDTSRGISGTTAIFAVETVPSAVLGSVVVKVDEGGPFPIYRDFASSDGFSVYKDDGDKLLEPAEYAAGPVSFPGFSVTGDGQAAVVTVSTDPAKATGSSNYVITTHPSEAPTTPDRAVTFSVPVNGVRFSSGASDMPASAVPLSAVIDSIAPQLIPKDNFTPINRIPQAFCPNPAPTEGCGDDRYKVYRGGTVAEPGEQLAFINAANDLSDGAMLVVADATPAGSHPALYDVNGIPDPSNQAAELSIGNGTGRELVAGTKALNNQLTDTVYYAQWDLMGNAVVGTLTNDQCGAVGPNCPGPQTPRGNDVTAPKFTSYSVTVPNVTPANETALNVTGTVSGSDTAIPTNTTQPTGYHQWVVLQHVTQSGTTYTVAHEGPMTRSTSPLSGTTVTTTVNPSDDNTFPESGQIRASADLVDPLGNALHRISDPALKDTIAPGLISVSLIDSLVVNNQPDPGEKYRVVFDDPMNTSTIEGSVNTSMLVHDGSQLGCPTEESVRCVTWGQSPSVSHSSDNKVFFITMGEPEVGKRLPETNDEVRPAVTVKDPAGNGLRAGRTTAVIGAPFVQPVEARTIDTLAPTNVNAFGTGRDGVLDQIDVIFSGALNPASVALASSGGKFKVAVAGGDVVTPTATMPNSTTIRLSFVPNNGKNAQWTTSTTPIVSLTDGTVITASPSGQAIAAFDQIAEDKVGPIPVLMTTADTTSPVNSRLDRVFVKFSEQIVVDSIEVNPCGWTVTNYTDTVQPANSRPTASGTEPCASPRNKALKVTTALDTVALQLKELGTSDTDATPTVSFNAQNPVPPYSPVPESIPDCDPNGSVTDPSTPNCPLLDAKGNGVGVFSGIALDKVGPTIIGRATLDRDSDGHIDEIAVTFGDAPSTTTVGTAQFLVTEPGYTVLSVGLAPGTDKELRIKLVPSSSRKGDTINKPKVQYTGGLTDSASPANPAPTDSAGVITTDKAGPAITAACVAVPTGTAAAKKGTCPEGAGNKMILLMSELVDGGSLAIADFVVKQADSNGALQTKTITAAPTVDATTGIITLTFADNTLDPNKDAFVAFSAENVVLDTATVKNGNSQTATITAYGTPTVALHPTCPVVSNPGYCSGTYINTGATGTSGVTGWHLVDTGASSTPPAAPALADYGTAQPTRWPTDVNQTLPEGKHTLWLSGKDDFDRIADRVSASITMLHAPTILSSSVRFVDITFRSSGKWPTSQTLMDGDNFRVEADGYGSDAASWKSSNGACLAANMSVNYVSTTRNFGYGAVAPFSCDLHTNTEIPYRHMVFPTVSAVGTTRYPIGTVLKTSPSDPGWLIVDGPNGTQLRRHFISVNARRSWQISDALVIQVPSKVLQGLHTGTNLGYRDGAVVHTSGSSSYYYILNGEKHPVSKATLSYWRIPLTSTYTVMTAERDAMPTKSSYGPGAHPVGTWIKLPSGAIQQIVSVGGVIKRRALASTAALRTLVPTAQIYPSNWQDTGSTRPLDTFVRGYRDGTLLKVTGGYAVIARGSLRKFANAETFNTLGYNALNAFNGYGYAISHVSGQSYRVGSAIDRYLIGSLKITVRNIAGQSTTATVLPSLNGIYGVGTLDSKPVGWDSSWS